MAVATELGVLSSSLEAGEPIKSSLYALLMRFQGTPSALSSIFSWSLDQLETVELHKQLAESVLDAYQALFHDLSAANTVIMIENISVYVTATPLRTGLAFELLERCLNHVAGFDAVPGDISSPANLIDHSINRLCGFAWSQVAAVGFCSAFKAFSFSKSQLNLTIDKLLRSMDNFAAGDLATLIHHLLLFAAKGARVKVLSAVLQHCQSQPRSDLEAVLPTVFVHFSIGFRQDAGLCRDLIKIIKDTGMHEISIMVAMLAASMQRFEEPVLEAVKGALIKEIKSNNRKKSSLLISELVKTSHVHQSALEACVDTCPRGCEQVLGGLLKCALSLLEPVRDDTHGTATTVGSSMIIRLFAVHPAGRSACIHQLCQRILACGSSEGVVLCKLLKQLLLQPALAMEPLLRDLKETTAYLHVLEGAVSNSLAQALVPVFAASEDFRDTLAMTLRKGLFHREETGRSNALNAIVTLASQTPRNKQDALNVVRELCSCLRRCLNQQATVRSSLYKSLASLELDDEDLINMALELVSKQLFKSTRASDQGSPLVKDELVKMSANVAVRLEALSDLFQCASKLTTTLAADHDTVKAIHVRMKQVCKSLASCAKEDFGIEAAADYTPESSVGMYNRQLAASVVEAYEGALAYMAATEFGTSLDVMGDLIALFKKRKSIIEVVKSSDKKSKLGQTPSLWHTPSMDKIMRLMLTEKDPALKTQCAFLRSKAEFVHFWMLCVSNLPVSPLRPTLLRSIFIELSARPTDSLIRDAHLDRKDKASASLRIVPIEFVARVLDDVQLRDELPSFLKAFNSAIEGSSETAQWEQEFVAWAIQLAIGCLDHSQPKEFQGVLSILNSIVTTASHHLIGKRLLRILKADPIEDASTLKTLLLVTLRTRPAALEALCEACLAGLGFVSTDDDTQSAPETLVTAIPKKLLQNGIVPTTLLAAVENLLSDLDWLMKLLTSTLKTLAQQDPPPTHFLEMEEAVSAHFLYLIKGLGVLLKVDLAKTSVTLNLFKVMRKSYLALTELVKLYQLRTNRFKDDGLPRHVQKAIHGVGLNLSQHVYRAIELYNTCLNDEPTTKRSSGKAKQDAKIVPDLVFSIELFERHLITLAKKTELNLLKCMKRSTARDFRINADKVAEAVADAAMGVDDDNDDGEGSEGGGDRSPPITKKSGASAKRQGKPKASAGASKSKKSKRSK